MIVDNFRTASTLSYEVLRIPADVVTRLMGCLVGVSQPDHLKHTQPLVDTVVGGATKEPMARNTFTTAAEIYSKSMHVGPTQWACAPAQHAAIQ